ncbi:DUF4837 family protein [Bacteroidota bacterium]
MKKRIICLSVIIISLLTSLMSCKTDSRGLLPVITGKAGELVIVVADKYWESKIGDSLRTVFAAQQIALPQFGTVGGEVIFDIINMPQAGFKDIIRGHRNIIVTSISSEYKEAKIVVKKDYWAKGQILVSMNAPNQDSFIKLLDDNKEQLVEKILKAERERQIRINKKYENSEAARQLSQNHELTLNAPKGFNIVVDNENFVWFKHETNDMTQNIIIYYQDFPGLDIFNSHDILRIRDSVLQVRVPGDKDGSYMTTERRPWAPIYSQEIKINNRYTYILRGLWRVNGDSMGGPFVSYTTVDEKRNRLVTIEGFVYRPNKPKRNAIRKVESIICTLAFN